MFIVLVNDVLYRPNRVNVDGMFSGRRLRVLSKPVLTLVAIKTIVCASEEEARYLGVADFCRIDPKAIKAARQELKDERKRRRQVARETREQAHAETVSRFLAFRQERLASVAA